LNKILSPGNNKKELKIKYEVYEESGVREYWIIHPDEQTVMTYSLMEGKYIPSKLFTSVDFIASNAIVGFCMDLAYVFKDLE